MISDWWMAKNGFGVSGLGSGKSGRAKSRPSSKIVDPSLESKSNRAVLRSDASRPGWEKPEARGQR